MSEPVFRVAAEDITGWVSTKSFDSFGKAKGYADRLKAEQPDWDVWVTENRQAVVYRT